jgi:hypothetical protein
VHSPIQPQFAAMRQQHLRLRELAWASTAACEYIAAYVSKQHRSVQAFGTPQLRQAASQDTQPGRR